VHNCLPYAVEVFYKLSIDANGRCGEVEPGDTFSLPCEVVYTEPHQILFKPRDGRCENHVKIKRVATVLGARDHVTCTV